MAIKSFEAKLGKMRKPQTFVVYPRKSATELVTVQSDKTIGRFDPQSGQGVINFKGNKFLHLSMLGAEPFTLPADVLQLALGAGAVNSAGVVNLFGPNPEEKSGPVGEFDDCDQTPCGDVP